VKQGLDIALAVQNSQYQHVTIINPVDDNVIAYGKATTARP